MLVGSVEIGGRRILEPSINASHERMQLSLYTKRIMAMYAHLADPEVIEKCKKRAQCEASNTLDEDLKKKKNKREYLKCQGCREHPKAKGTAKKGKVRTCGSSVL